MKTILLLDSQVPVRPYGVIVRAICGTHCIFQKRLCVCTCPSCHSVQPAALVACSRVCSLRHSERVPGREWRGEGGSEM